MKKIVVLLVSLFFTHSAISDAGVDLHQHLFMKHGVGIFLQGDFSSPIRSTSWDDRFKTKANRETLTSSRLGIVVVSLYAHPWLTQKWLGGMGGLEQSLDAQVQELKQFVESSHGAWVIARTANEAKIARSQGKKVFVLSLETAAGILDQPEGVQKWIDQVGVRIVTFMHLSPDSLGGVALWPGIGFFNAPLDWIRSFFKNKKDQNGFYVNTQGLTPQGEALLKELAKRNVWIDFSHSSDRTQEDMIRVLSSRPQPALYTHTALRKYLRGERGISDSQLKRVQETGGVLGLVFSEMMVNPVLHQESIGEGCERGFAPLVQEWKEAVQKTSAPQVMVGSDFNAPLTGIRSGCQKAFDLQLIQKGFFQAGSLPQMMNAMRLLGAPIPIDLKEQEEAFLNAWSKVNP